MSLLQVRGVLDGAAQAGVAAQRLLDATGFDASRLDVPDGWATVEELDRLIEAAIEVSRDPALGLHWGETTSGIRLGVLAPLVASSKTLRDAFSAMVRFQRIISEFDEVVALSSEQGLRLICAGPATSELAGRARKELAVVGFARMLRHFCGRNGVPRGVAFDYSPPSYEAEYARVFEGRALFRQSWCGVDIPTELLDVPQPGWSLELYRVMEGHAEAALASMEGSLPIRARVARALHQAYPRWLDMSEVARELDVSERTLRRHLSREGLVFFRDPRGGAMRDRDAPASGSESDHPAGGVRDGLFEPERLSSSIQAMDGAIALRGAAREPTTARVSRCPVAGNHWLPREMPRSVVRLIDDTCLPEEPKTTRAWHERRISHA